MIVEIVYLPSVMFSNAMNAVKERKITQRSMAGFYADCIRAHHGPDAHGQSVDWKTLNAAIIERWSDKGLDRIKKTAWRDVLYHCPQTKGTP